jgi:hypothetical protein
LHDVALPRAEAFPLGGPDDEAGRPRRPTFPIGLSCRYSRLNEQPRKRRPAPH